MTAPAPAPREYEVAARSTDVFGRVQCSARTHHFIIDGPVQNGCPGEEVTPPEAFLSGIAACAVELVQVIAKDQGVGIRDVSANIRGVIDRSRQPRPDVTVFTSVRLGIRIAGADAAQAAAIVEGFKRR